MNQIKAYMAHHKKRIALIAAFFFLILLGRALYQILFPPKTAKTIPYVRTIRSVRMKRVGPTPILAQSEANMNPSFPSR